MTRPTLERAAKAVALGLALVFVTGCALHRANKALEEGRYEEAAKAYQEAVRKDPGNVKARMGYRRAAVLAAEQHMEKAKECQKRGQEEQALDEVRKALVLDPNNGVAVDWLAAYEDRLAKQQAAAEAQEDPEAMKERLEGQDSMRLNPRSVEGMNLNIGTRQSLREVLRNLSTASGVNILFHTSYQDTQIQVDLRGLSFQRILDTLMLQNDLFYKVLDPNSIMIFKENPQNREKYENQLIKTFYLSNAEVDGVRQVLTTLMPQLKIFPDKRLNAVVVKAKPHELSIAKRVVNQLDKAKAEVMVYLELLEITESSLEQVGLLPTILTPGGDAGGIYRIGATLDDPFKLNQNKGAIRISKSDVRFLFPNLALDALKSSGDAKLVASPNVRVVSGEAGEVNIGEKITSTQSSISGLGGAGAQGGAGGIPGIPGGVGQTQYGYEDVGVKIKVEPRVHHNGDITLKIDSKVTTRLASSVSGRPDLGQREIKTFARLRDGETAVFAGLLKEEEQKSLQGIWGISDIPVLGKLLGSNRNSKAKTDVLLTIRTVLVRRPNFTAEDLVEFDPDQATSRSGPFTPKPAAKVVKPQPGAPRLPIESPLHPPAASPAPTPALATPDKVEKGGSAESREPGKPAVPAVPPTPAPGSPVPKTPEPQESELVFFLSPITEEIVKGEHVRLSIIVSGARGVTSGTLDLRIDPRLKVVNLEDGDFLTGDQGSLQRNLGPDGVGKLSFKRSGRGDDGGTLVILELEGVAPGNAPVMIQGGQFLVNANPVTGRFVNALVTVTN